MVEISCRQDGDEKKGGIHNHKENYACFEQGLPSALVGQFCGCKIRPTNNAEDEGDGAGKIEGLNDLTLAGRCGGVFGKTLA